MRLKGKVAVVTGGANGIGRALSVRFAQEGAKAVVVADLDKANAQRVADEISSLVAGAEDRTDATKGLAVVTDVGSEADVKRLVETAREHFGPIDLFCSNAGITGPAGGLNVTSKDWQTIWDINVMAHVHAANAVLPEMLARGEGYLLNTASAAGLLTSLGSALYSVTKHAAVAFAEWLSITYGDAGIKVSCLCPQGVNTNMLRASSGGASSFLRDGAIEPEQLADTVIKALEEETFLILPHPEVKQYWQRKTSDYDRWIRGMRRLQERLNE